jgi:hypothetical protein
MGARREPGESATGVSGKRWKTVFEVVGVIAGVASAIAGIIAIFVTQVESTSGGAEFPTRSPSSAAAIPNPPAPSPAPSTVSPPSPSATPVEPCVDEVVTEGSVRLCISQVQGQIVAETYTSLFSDDCQLKVYIEDLTTEKSIFPKFRPCQIGADVEFDVHDLSDPSDGHIYRVKIEVIWPGLVNDVKTSKELEFNQEPEVPALGN